MMTKTKTCPNQTQQMIILMMTKMKRKVLYEGCPNVAEEDIGGTVVLVHSAWPPIQYMIHRISTCYIVTCSPTDNDVTLHFNILYVGHTTLEFTKM